MRGLWLVAVGLVAACLLGLVVILYGFQTSTEIRGGCVEKVKHNAFESHVEARVCGSVSSPDTIGRSEGAEQRHVGPEVDV